MVYNIMTGAGFGREVLGGLSMAWLGMAVLFFIVIFSNKWLGELSDFNQVWAFLLAYGTYLIIITLSGHTMWALMGGIIGAMIGGFLMGYFMPSGGDYY